MAKRSNLPSARELVRVKELCAEKGADPAIVAGIDKALELLTDREDYCAAVSSEPSPALHAIYQETKTHPFEEVFKQGKSKWNLMPGMITGPLNGGFMQAIASASRAKRVLEIGMFTGYGALAFAEVLPPDGQVVTCENDPYLEPLARGLFNKSPHGNKIQIRIGPAADTLTALAAEKVKPFDIVFIDANKDGYIGYYKAVMENNLLAKGGTILFDNALMDGAAYLKGEDLKKATPSAKAIRKCNEFLQSQDDIFRVMVPIGDGVFMVRRKDDTFSAS